MKTTLIHNGASPRGIELIRELLSENDLQSNNIKNRVICIDTPDKLYELEEFMGQDEFTFYAVDPASPIDINETIDKVIIINK